MTDRMVMLWQHRWFFLGWILMANAMQLWGPVLFGFALATLILLTKKDEQMVKLWSMPLGMVLTMLFQ